MSKLANPGKLDLNWGNGVSGDHIHANSLDYNEELDQVVVNASRMSEFWVIDHGNTFIPGNPENSIALAAGPKGDILYRWGNPSVFDHGEEPSCYEGQNLEGHQQVHFSHDIQWIKPGLPGAGHFLLFNNGACRVGVTRSEIIEVDTNKVIFYSDFDESNESLYRLIAEAHCFDQINARSIRGGSNKKEDNIDEQARLFELIYEGDWDI